MIVDVNGVSDDDMLQKGVLSLGTIMKGGIQESLFVLTARENSVTKRLLQTEGLIQSSLFRPVILRPLNEHPEIRAIYHEIHDFLREALPTVRIFSQSAADGPRKGPPAEERIWRHIEKFYAEYGKAWKDLIRRLDGFSRHKGINPCVEL